MEKKEKADKIAQVERLICAIKADQPNRSPSQREESEKAVEELGNARDALLRKDEKNYYQWKAVALWRLRQIYADHPPGGGH
jgi:hypothetical protein